MPKKLFIIHKIIYFSKKLLFFQIRDFKSKITRKNFKIHNLEGNQMYFKNIGLHFAYISNK